MLIVLLGILWGVLGVVLALRFRDDHAISQFELTRLSNQGDKQARELLARQHRAVELESLRYIFITIFSTFVVTTAVFAFGVWPGVLIGASLLLIAPILIRVKALRTLADKLRDLVYPYALKLTDLVGPILRALRERDGEAGFARVYSQAELMDLIHRSPGVLNASELKRLEASLKFEAKMVGDIMTPKSQIVTADVHDTLGPLVLDDLHKTGHSRFPVIDGNDDHVVGMLYLKELVDLKSEHQTVRAAMKKNVHYIREDQALEHALHGFLRSHQHLFVVVNEYRETVGVVSLEDVIEALIGSKIVDEFDRFDDLRAVAERNPHKNNQAAQARDV